MRDVLDTTSADDVRDDTVQLREELLAEALDWMVSRVSTLSNDRPHETAGVTRTF